MTEDKWPESRFIEFYDWLYVQGGFGIVLDWGMTFEGEYVREGAEAPMTDSKRVMIDLSKAAPEVEAALMAEELAAKKEAHAIPMTAINMVLQSAFEHVPKEQLRHVQDGVVKQFKQEPKLYVTRNDDRCRILLGSLPDTVILSPSAVLEIELLFDVALVRGEWRRKSDGEHVGVKNPIREKDPISIADYMRKRSRSWPDVVADLPPGKVGPVNPFGGPEQQMVGPWPKYSKEFMEARLKAGKG